MAIKCAKCQFEADATDAFCRKCGAPVAQEASFKELGSVESGTPSGPVKVVEVNALTTPTPTAPSVGQGRTQKIKDLSKRVGSKLSDALQTEPGKKLTQSATSLVVAIGTELLTQAVSRRTGKSPTGKDKNTPPTPARPVTNVTDALIKAMEDNLATSGQSADEIQETYVYERIYQKRIIRKRPQ